MNAHIVLGLGFGDEGKGITTDYLVKKYPSAIVIRFSGGQQSGHTVVDSVGNRHVFSNFGSGTLRDVPTYWSKYCTFHPNGLIKEYNKLRTLIFRIDRLKLYVDALSQVTTPYDILYNQAVENSRDRPHGSCGVGIGTTIERNTTPYKMYAQDLKHPAVRLQKLKAIEEYYQLKVLASDNKKLIDYYNQWDFTDAKLEFLKATDECLQIINVVSQPEMFYIMNGNYSNLIFEGSQGILLDMDFGFFPNVTRANVTSKNAMTMLKEYGLDRTPENINTYYVTRAYQARHGIGHMTNEQLPLKLEDNPNETNVFNEWQTNFRKSVLDIDLLNYAFQCDANFQSKLSSKSLVITCLDQIDGNIQATVGGKVKNYAHPAELLSELMVKFNPVHDKVYTSYSDCSDEMKRL